jgi:hypothetical protein
MGYSGRMTGHGFCSLAMGVIKERLGYRHEVVDRQLSHQSDDTYGEAYDRAEFKEERKKMMSNMRTTWMPLQAIRQLPADAKHYDLIDGRRSSSPPCAFIA